MKENKGLVNKYVRQYKEVNERAEEVLKRLGKITKDLDLVEIEKIINRESQNIMTTIHQFIERNNDIPREEIFKQLQKHKYIELLEIENSKNKAVICVKPYTDLYLKPTVIENGYFDYKQILVISKEAEEVMQNFCNDYRKKVRK